MVFVRRNLNVVAFLILFVGMFFAIFQTQQYTRNTRHALCTFREELQARTDRGATRIVEIKAGVRVLQLGESIPDLESVLASRRANLRALSDLEC
jgi:hypothetical protein